MGFDLEKYKEYISTYDAKNYSDETIVKDMLYGVGISLDEKKYSMANGFKNFINYLKITLKL